MWRDVPPTDSELFERGLGIMPTSPPDIALDELYEADRALREGLTPRRTEPPSEIQVAVELHYAAQDPSPEGTIKKPRSPRIRPPPIVVKSPSNAYSLGTSLPRGASWRYVDVLNRKDTDKEELPC